MATVYYHSGEIMGSVDFWTLDIEKEIDEWLKHSYDPQGDAITREELRAEFDEYNLNDPDDRERLIFEFRVDHDDFSGLERAAGNCDKQGKHAIALAVGACKKHFRLMEVMTASEIEKEFGLGSGTVRQACYRNQVFHRKSEGTLQLFRADAEKQWGKDW